ncbi:MAG: alpha/beta hydrolase [Pseudomonadota bacterium]
MDLTIAEAPKNGVAYWLVTNDGVRIRVGLWKPESCSRGTVLVFPGRTEYVEKYGRTVVALTQMGFTCLVVDWRGQGLADRNGCQPMLGHVDHFSEYQEDVATVVATMKDLELPQPWNLVGHSLGACIGLRAVHNGLSISSCAFTSPMWRLSLPLLQRLMARPVSGAARLLGLGRRFAPGTTGLSYVLQTDFDFNRLTSDPEMYRYFVKQATNLTEHQIGGPSIGWLNQMLKELRVLSRIPSPEIPCLTFFGDLDVLIDIEAVRHRMANWPNGKLNVIAGAKHDLLSERPAIRTRLLTDLNKFFAS